MPVDDISFSLRTPNLAIPPTHRPFVTRPSPVAGARSGDRAIYFDELPLKVAGRFLSVFAHSGDVMNSRGSGDGHRVSERIADRAAAIHQYLRDHADQALARKYSFAAARYEQLRLAQYDAKTTPGDDATLQDLTGLLRIVSKRLGLGHNVTGRNGFLPCDPQRLVSESWVDCARLWFG